MGCDKTTPSLLMGASSVDLPTIGVSGGPMLNGKWRGQELGSGTGVWSMSEQVRAGTLKLQDFFEAESCMHRSHGHCMTMGTASTMASMVEALGRRPARQRGLSGGRRPPQRAGAHGGPAHRRHGAQDLAVEDPHAPSHSRTRSRRWPRSAAPPTR
jgi:hypothetical protein